MEKSLLSLDLVVLNRFGFKLKMLNSRPEKPVSFQEGQLTLALPFAATITIRAREV